MLYFYLFQFPLLFPDKIYALLFSFSHILPWFLSFYYSSQKNVQMSLHKFMNLIEKFCVVYWVG